MKISTAKVERLPTAAEALAEARAARDQARSAMTAAAAKAERVRCLSDRLEAAQQGVTAITTQHAQDVAAWATAGATGQPPQPDANALKLATTEVAAARQQADAAGLAEATITAEYSQLVAAYPGMQQGVIEAAIPVALGEIHEARAARDKALAAWNCADARIEVLTATITRQQNSAAARAAVRELDDVHRAEVARGRKQQDLALAAEHELARRYWDSLIG